MKKVSLKNLAVSPDCRISSAEKKEIQGGIQIQKPIDEVLCSIGSIRYSVWGCSQTGWFTFCLPCTDPRAFGHPDCPAQAFPVDEFPLVKL